MPRRASHAIGLLAGLALLGIAIPGALPAQSLFSRSLNGGPDPSQIVFGDLNGDDRLDLVSASFDLGGASVRLRNPDGSFQPPFSFGIGLRPRAPLLVDLNSDGNLDLVVGVDFPSPDFSRFTDDVAVLPGIGNGSFFPPRLVEVGGGPSRIETSDVDVDGVPDLVVTNGLNGSITVLLGRGDFTFRRLPEFLPGGNARSARIADMNQDGRDDLAVQGRRHHPPHRDLHSDVPAEHDRARAQGRRREHHATDWL